ncbi:MAG: hypothetical protein ACOCRK_05160 [bacterium]
MIMDIIDDAKRFPKVFLLGVILMFSLVVIPFTRNTVLNLITKAISAVDNLLGNIDANGYSG